MIGAVTTANLSKLNYRSGNSANAMENSTRKMIFAGNSEESARLGGDAGAFLSRTRMGVETRNKSTLARSMQNAVSYVQTQEAGMRKLESIYNRMTQLASLAADPFLDDGVRTQLNSEFQSLKQDSFDMRNETYMGNFLYDDMAAKYFPVVDFGQAFTDKAVDGQDGLQRKNLSSPPSGWTGTPEYYQLEKEVHFNSGKFVLEINGGGTGERYILKQGTQTIFDTAGGTDSSDSGNSKDMQWATGGNAYTQDFDRFEIEYAPGKETTFKFVPLTPGNNIYVAGPDETVGTADDPKKSDLPGPDKKVGTLDDGYWPKNKNGSPSNETVWWEDDETYDNKNLYIQQLGLGTSDGDNSKPWNAGDDRTNYLFSGDVGELKTFAANGQSTKLTLRVEANTIFQINATYTPLEEATNNKTVESGSENNVVLDAVGIGITLIDSSIDSVANAQSSLDFLQKEIESVAEQLGTIGANLSELEVATERLQNKVYLSEKGLSRLGQDALIEESTRFAKQNIKSQAATALLSQAFSISEKVLNVIL